MSSPPVLYNACNIACKIQFKFAQENAQILPAVKNTKVTCQISLNWKYLMGTGLAWFFKWMELLGGNGTPIIL